MKTHELARLLIEMPDIPVIGGSVGQGCSEGEDSPLCSAELQMNWKDEEIAVLAFE